MKSNEFRIYNLVLCRGELSVITSIDQLQIGYLKSKTGEKRIPLTLVKQIPLTEEWLLKFGFQFYFIGNGDCKIKQWYFEDFTLCGFNYYYNLEIKYIHQLQNLFFAIKGKELIYNNEGTKENNQMD